MCEAAGAFGDVFFQGLTLVGRTLLISNDYKRILLTLSTGKDLDNNPVVTDPLILAIYNDAQTRL
ncbi:MAG: hypothetical protein U5M23_09760, partial [Marinagarivorans sp.]|nr:hypothetical protein [Marinagarivorans sp.]